MKKKSKPTKASSKKNGTRATKGGKSTVAKRKVKKVVPEKLIPKRAFAIQGELDSNMRQVWCITQRKSFGTFPLEQAEIERQNHLKDFPNHDVILRGNQRE